MIDAQDTIVALSTAAGNAPRTVVRLSGPQSIPLGETLFRATLNTTLEQTAGFRFVDGRLILTGLNIELPCRAYLFRAPRSYTRQDVLELHFPASAPLAAAVVSILVDSGARPARPGEFTLRAFLSGRLDLSQAQAVGDLIDASNDAQLRSAVATLGGQLHRLCAQTSETLSEALAVIEASIDLAEEDIQLDRPADLARRLRELSKQLNEISDQAAHMPETADAPQVVLAGEPNVGKSSLLNVLSKSDRAITSATAGTTRDVLRTEMNLPDAPQAMLVDAAGFATDPTDPLQTDAENAAKRAVQGADLILMVIDAIRTPDTKCETLAREIIQTNPRAEKMILVNKIDLRDTPPQQWRPKTWDPDTQIHNVSAKTDEGIEPLRSALAKKLDRSVWRPGELLGLHDRQRRHLRSASTSADHAAAILQPADQLVDVAELVAVELRDALQQVGKITGQVVTEDILGRIFSRFCVGK